MHPENGDGRRDCRRLAEDADLAEVYVMGEARARARGECIGITRQWPKLAEELAPIARRLGPF